VVTHLPTFDEPLGGFVIVQAVLGLAQELSLLTAQLAVGTKLAA